MPGKFPVKEKQKGQKPAWALAFRLIGSPGNSSVLTLPGNPGFPAGETIFGIKFDLNGDQRTVTFDSTRQPMWGDFYAKGGSSSFAYNADVGVGVANVNDYNAVPIDALGGSLSKVLVPDTIPEPTSMMLLAIAGAAIAARRRS